MKIVLMYPAILAAAMWIIYNIYKINVHSQYLKDNFPQCTTTNPNRVYIFVATMAGLVLTQKPFERLFQNIFDKFLPSNAKFPIGTLERVAKT